MPECAIVDTDLLGEILEHLAADIVELPGSDPQRGIGGQRRFVGGSRSRMGVEPLLGRTAPPGCPGGVPLRQRGIMKRSERYPGDSVKLGRLDRGESVDFGLFAASARAIYRLDVRCA
jgi:hypothetical protein